MPCKEHALGPGAQGQTWGLECVPQRRDQEDGKRLKRRTQPNGQSMVNALVSAGRQHVLDPLGPPEKCSDLQDMAKDLIRSWRSSGTVQRLSVHRSQNIRPHVGWPADTPPRSSKPRLLTIQRGSNSATMGVATVAVVAVSNESLGSCPSRGSAQELRGVPDSSWRLTHSSLRRRTLPW